MLTKPDKPKAPKTPRAAKEPAKAAPKPRPSQRKIAANRANAKKSTGPKTEAGKERSAQNAVKHRLTSRRFWLADEERADYLARQEALYDALRPQSEAEARLVDLAAMSLWRMFRVPAMEAELIEAARTGPAGEDVGLGLAFQRQEQSLGRLTRYAANLQREMNRALAELRRLQADRRAAQRRALRGEDEWAPGDFPTAARAPDGKAPGGRNEAMLPAPDEAPAVEPAPDGQTPGARNEANAWDGAGEPAGEPGEAATGESGPRKEATRGGKRGRSRHDGKAAGLPRRVSPEWQEYLHGEAERVRRLGAARLAGAPGPTAGDRGHGDRDPQRRERAAGDGGWSVGFIGDPRLAAGGERELAGGLALERLPLL